MWLILAFVSAALLGFYDLFKKTALHHNAVLPVLLLNTLFSTLIFLPVILSAELSLGWFSGTILDIPRGNGQDHLLVILKSMLVLTSWIFGYFGLKHLPLTIVGPINATRPMMVLLGAILIFGEKLNVLQWAGVIISVVSLFLLGRSSRREGVDFRHNKWIVFVALAAVTGALSGLYDKYIVREIDPVFVQSWYNLYQLMFMTVIVGLLWLPRRGRTTPFHWSWAIPFISIFLSMADFAYFYSLSLPDAMISVVSMVRRGSVLISFAGGALWLKEKNLRSKALDLVLVIIGMIFLYFGTRY